MGVKKFQLFGYTSFIIGYNCAKFIVLASLVSGLAEGVDQNDPPTPWSLTLQKTP